MSPTSSMLPSLFAANAANNPLFQRIMDIIDALYGGGPQTPSIDRNRPVYTAPPTQPIEDAIQKMQSPYQTPSHLQGGLSVGAGTITGPTQSQGFMRFNVPSGKAQFGASGFPDQRGLAQLDSLKQISGDPVPIKNNTGTYDPYENMRLQLMDRLQSVLSGADMPTFRINDQYGSTPAPWLGTEYQNQQAQGIIGLMNAMSATQAPHLEADAKIQAALAEAAQRAQAEKYKADAAAGARIQEQQLSGQNELDQVRMQGILEAIKQAIGTNTDPKQAMRMVLMLLKGLSNGGSMDQLVSGMAEGGNQGPK